MDAVKEKEIVEILDGPIRGEVVSLVTEGMVKEAILLAKIYDIIVVTLPAIPFRFEALKIVSSERVRTNFTVVHTSNQALLAAKNGATYVSSFIERLDANTSSGSQLTTET